MTYIGLQRSIYRRGFVEYDVAPIDHVHSANHSSVEFYWTASMGYPVHARPDSVPQGKPAKGLESLFQILRYSMLTESLRN